MFTGSLKPITASYCFTSSWSGTQPYVPIQTKETLQEKSGEVKNYFEKLGYEVSWDFNKRSREKWWEISDDEGLIVQIDMGVPLSDIIEDICQFHQGKPGTSKSDYKLSGPDSDRMKELWKKVYENRT